MGESDRELQLLQQATAGNVASLELLLAIYRDSIVDYVSRHLPEDMRPVLEAEDVLQDTYIEAFRRIRGFVPDGSDAFYRWLVTIARNRLIHLVRALRSGKRGGGRLPLISADGPEDLKTTLALLEQLAVHRRTPSRSAMAHEVVAAVERSLQRLPEHYRLAVQMRHLEGLSPKEGAQRMGRTERAFQMLCNRGLKVLRRELESDSRFL